jgi:tryptophan halogenase
MIDSICILGGGTSGLLSALVIKHAHPEISIKVVKSDQVGIIGVGEGATEHWGIFCDYMGINLYDAVTECGGTIKFGIMFKDWGVPDYLHSVVHTQSFLNGEQYPVYTKLISENAPHLEFSGRSRYTNTVPGSWCDLKTTSGTRQFHFNALLLNNYLLKLCEKWSIDVVVDDINDVEIVDNRVVSLVGRNKHTADFFIDSSGMSKFIIKRLGGQWNSYSKHLLTNSAIAFPTEDTDEYPVYTTAQAMKYGWMWNTPVQGRWGNGYVFCDKYINFEQAQQEVEEKLGRPVNIFKKFKFDPGCLDKGWISNCLAIGLSSGFVEPLESSAISQGLLESWLFLNLLPTYSSDPNSAREVYNQRHNTISDNILDFIAVHYVTPREDTEFWKYLKENKEHWMPESLKINLKKWHKRMPLAFEFDNKWTLFKAENWILTLYGLGLMDTESIKKEYDQISQSMKITIQEKINHDTSIWYSQINIPHKQAIEKFLNNYNKRIGTNA